MTYDHLIKKDAFYWYKANWSSEPLAYITSRRFNPRTTPPIDAKVYSNLPTVTLNVNGAAVGSLSATDHVFRWTGVPLEVGDNAVEAVASDSAGQVTARDAVTWTRQ